MQNIFAKMLYELEKHHDMMLVSIVESDGSTPRGTGSQMLVNRRCRQVGTIGGGAIEHRSEAFAVDLVAKRENALHRFELHEGAAEDIGMVCGGDAEVLFNFVSGQSAAWNEVAGAVCDRIADRTGGMLVLPLAGGDPVLLDGTGAVVAGSAELADALEDASKVALSSGGCLREQGVFTLSLPIGERLVIFGGGHIAQSLVPIAANTGFRPWVMDDRPEYAADERFPQAERVICGDFADIAHYLELRPQDYCIVMTNGHGHDFECQEQLLRLDLAYVGVIGSASKTAAVNAKLHEAGISPAATARIHTPIGLKIGAVTPDEIAVSIAAELIACRAQARKAGR